MKLWRDPTSPWRTRLHFDPEEFEVMMDDLRLRTGSDCFTSGRGVDIDFVLLKALEIEPDFVDLPEGIMGRTLFHPDGRAEVQVSRKLADQAETNDTGRRRLRTTLAHESGHVACHRSLFLRDTESLSLFAGDDQDTRPPIMCRGESIRPSRYTGEWWEYQANQCMAAVLFPRELFRNHVSLVLRELGRPSFEDAVCGGVAENALRQLSKTFDVSMQATVLRLEALGYLPPKGQTKLDFSESN